MEPITYFLRPHVHLCTTIRYVVVLDVRRDRYLCIPRERFNPLIPWLSGWSLPGSMGRSGPAPLPDSAAAQYAGALIAQGILTTDPLESKAVRSPNIPLPRAEAPSDPKTHLFAVMSNMPAFTLACRRADSALTRRRFEDVVRAVAARRHAHGNGGTAEVAPALRISRVFSALRLLYPRPYLCTFDSLALLELLALRNLHPSWVFGVQADPFQAHCWVQLGDVLLNDRLERIVPFTPILSV